jgi:hypothetical protein
LENFKETKEKSIGYPKVNIKEIPNDFNEATINDAAKQFNPVSNLFNNFYNGLSDYKKEYLYGHQVYVPEAYPSHYYNTNTFSPAYLAEVRRQNKQDDEF